jgi:hypothetical protein
VHVIEGLQDHFDYKSPKPKLGENHIKDGKGGERNEEGGNLSRLVLVVFVAAATVVVVVEVVVDVPSEGHGGRVGP